MERRRPGTWSRWRRAAAALAAALPALAGAHALALPSEQDVWIRRETANFILFSNASESHTRDVGNRLETFRHVLARLNPDLNVNSPLPTYIFVFKNDHSFTPYKKRVGGAAVSMAGYFVSHRDANYVVLNATPEGDPFAPVYHEYVHYVFLNNFERLPLWFNEGIAECYTTFHAEADRVDIGRPLDDYVRWLRANRMMPLADLFAVDTDSKQYNEKERQGAFYAGSWALVHYLIWGKPEWKSHLPDHLRRLDRGESLASLLKPVTYDDLERQLTDYVRRGKYLYSAFAVGELKVDDAATTTPMTRDEVLYRLGDFLAHSDQGRLTEAEEHFREALRLNPDRAGAHAGIGFVRDLRGRHEEAAAHYEKALALDPNDYLTCFLYASSLSGTGGTNGISRGALPDATPPGILKARELFARSIRLRPALAEAYAGLGATYSFERGDLSDGIAALEKARRMLPSRMDIAFNLVALYARHGDREKARDLVDDVLGRAGDPAMLAEAREAMVQGDLAAADALLSAGREEEGLRLLEEVVTGTSDPDRKRQLETQVREIRQTLETNRQIALYNQAVDRANRKDYKGAAALLERVAREAKDPGLAKKARKLLADVKRASGRV